MQKTKSAGHRAWYLHPVLWKTLSVLLLIGVAWLIYLDAQVRYKFEGKRWEIPAQVYARALEIYEGRALSAENLDYELGLLGYRQRPNAPSPGSFARHEQSYVLHIRRHQLADGKHPSAKIRFRLNGDVVSDLQTLSGAKKGLYTLDPYKIGGIYPGSRQERVVLAFEDIPEPLIAALLATEDREFFDHWGVSPWAIMRAMWANIQAGSIVQGGSTLTQQLVKNFYLSRDRSLWRKLNEALMSLMLEAHYSKEDILETYVNDIFLGQAGATAIHGFGMASRFYFGKALEDCSVDQLAMLVAMVKGPSYYNPRRYPDRVKERRDLVLRLMAQEGFINEPERDSYQRRRLAVVAQARIQTNRYPAFMDLVQRQLSEDYDEEDLRSEGLRLYTTLDPQVQWRLERATERVLPGLPAGTDDAALQTGAVMTSSGTGEVVAMLGDRDPRYQGFNRALDAHRPIGSLIKPAVYLSALMQPSKYHLMTPLSDQPFRIEFENDKIWEPDNFSGESHEDVPLYYALSRSLNLATARLGLEVGVDQVIDTLRKMGVEGDINPYPSLLLGAQSLSPLMVSQFYQTLASNGFNMPLRAIREVTTAEGETLSRYTVEVDQVLPPEAVYLLHYAMAETMRSGTGRSAFQVLPQSLAVAGKTGTTNDNRDSWFAGFSGDYLGVVWVGRDDNGKTALTGATGALRIWRAVFADIPQYPLSMPKPAEIDYHWVQPERGVLTDKRCEGALALPFWEDPEDLPYAACETGTSRLRKWFESWF